MLVHGVPTVPPVTVMVPPPVSALMVPWLISPSVPLPTWRPTPPALARMVMPLAMVRVPDVGRTNSLPLLPANTTSPLPPKVWLPLKSSAVVPPIALLEFRVTLLPAFTVSPFNTVTVVPLAIDRLVPSVTPLSVAPENVGVERPAPLRLMVAFLMIAPLPSVAVLVPPMVSVPPDNATCDEIVVVPAPPGLMFRLSTSPPATLSVMAPLITTLRLALSVSVLVPTPL